MDIVGMSSPDPTESFSCCGSQDRALTTSAVTFPALIFVRKETTNSDGVDQAFNQDFTPSDYVTVHIARAGLQLLPGSDVKERGLIVGSVQSISSTGDGADLRLRLG